MLKNFFLLFAFLLVSCATVAIALDMETGRFDKTFTTTGRPQISVENQDGRTSLKAGTGNQVIVHVVKEVLHASSSSEAEKLAQKTKVRVEQNGNQITVVSEYPKHFFVINFGRNPRVLVHFDITAPVQSDIKVRESDGPLDVSGFDGNIDLHAADGNVKAADCKGTVSVTTMDGKIDATKLQGELQLSASDGDVTLEDGSGNLILHASDGDARLTRFNGEVEARTADGKLFIDGLLTALTAKTSDGSMQIRLQPGTTMQKDWSIRSSDGDVELNLPDSFSADLDLETSDGHIETQLPIAIVGSVTRDHVQGKMNNGGHVLLIHTSDGDISINGQ